MGEAALYRVQHLLNRGRWDADAAQDRLRDYVLEELSSPDTVLAILRARGEKAPDGQVPFSVPELRHLLTRLLWRGWRGIEHLLHCSRWRRQHQFHALCCHYRKRGSPLPVFYLQLY